MRIYIRIYYSYRTSIAAFTLPYKNIAGRYLFSFQQLVIRICFYQLTIKQYDLLGQCFLICVVDRFRYSCQFVCVYTLTRRASIQHNALTRGLLVHEILLTLVNPWWMGRLLSATTCPPSPQTGGGHRSGIWGLINIYHTHTHPRAAVSQRSLCFLQSLIKADSDWGVPRVTQKPACHSVQQNNTNATSFICQFSTPSYVRTYDSFFVFFIFFSFRKSVFY
jgi:hypothetical protein